LGLLGPVDNPRSTRSAYELPRIQRAKVPLFVPLYAPYRAAMPPTLKSTDTHSRNTPNKPDHLVSRPVHTGSFQGMDFLESDKKDSLLF
jgi:hypothetical protein